MRTMYDSVTAANIPADAAMVAGYLDGLYRWSASDWARFPNAVKVGIAVFASTNNGMVLDVEKGNATPEEAPIWIKARRAAGCDPTVYCSKDTQPAIQAACQAQGVAEPHWWIAWYSAPDHSTPLPGTMALQYAADVAGPGSYDVSVVVDSWPGVDNGQTWPASHITQSLAQVESATTAAATAPDVQTAWKQLRAAQAAITAAMAALGS